MQPSEEKRVMAGDRAGALAFVDDDSIISRIQAGEHSSVVAQSLGVHKSAISHRFKDRVDYKEARELGTEVRLNEIEQNIAELSKPLPQPELPDDATDQELTRYKADLKAWSMSHDERVFNLARLTAQYKASSWRAAVEHPHRWGPKQEVTVVHVDLTAALTDARMRSERDITPQPVVVGLLEAPQQTEAKALGVGDDAPK